MKIKVPMQFFAEEGDNGAGTQPAGAGAQADGNTGAQNPNPAPQGDGQQQTNSASSNKTFTQEELDKVLSERLARQQKQYEAKLQKQQEDLAAKIEETAKLAKMNAEQKAQYEAQKREEELTAREQAVKVKELRYKALSMLEEKGMPSTLIDCVNLESAEAMEKSIAAMCPAWTNSISASVDAKLKSKNPPAHSGGNGQTDPFLDEFGM